MQETKTKPAPSPFNGFWSSSIGHGSRELFGETLTGEVKKSNPLRNNLCTHKRVKCTISSGACYETWAGNTTPFWGIMGYPQGAGYKLITSAYCNWGAVPSWPENTALTKAYEKYVAALSSAGRSDLQVISFAREMSKTVAMLKNPFSLVSGVSKLLGPKASQRCRNVPFGDLVKAGPGMVRLVAKKRVHPKSDRFKKAVDAGAGAWLEGTYGWQPFLNDVLGALPSVHTAMESRKQLKREGFRNFSYPVTFTADKSWTADSWSGKPYYVKEGHVSTSQKARLYGTWAVNPSVAAESAANGVLRALNIDRLGYAVWDAVPYSFVADWFLPLGGLVDNMLSGPTFYINATSPWLSLGVKSQVVVMCAPRPPQAGATTYSGGATYGQSVETFTRGPCDMGQLPIKAKGMHGTRVASGFALAWGAITRRLR